MNLNKLQTVTLASVLTAVASMPVMSAIDIDVTTDQKLDYATELKGTADANGRVAIAKNGTNLSVSGSTDIAAAIGAARYVRFDLTNGVFDGAPTVNMKTKADCSVDLAGVLEGGGDGQSFATYRMTPVQALVATCDWTITSGTGFKMDPTTDLSVSYGIYETVGQSTQTVYALAAIKTVAMANFVAGSVPADVVVASNATATVASDFRSFDNAANGVANGTLTSLGQLDASKVVSTTQATLTLAGVVAAATDFLTAAQTVTITGDVSQAVYTSQTGADCTGGTIACTANTAKTSCAITATAANADMYICANYAALGAGLKANKGSYSIGLSTDTGVTGSLGSVVYDTISVEIPYVTTYADYNQRIFIDNRGTVAADYTTSFTTEDGVTAVAGTGGAGTLAAGDITVIRASDLVTFTGGTRGSATLELEANSSNLKITTQIVDLGTGMTDTILLHPSTQQ
ncbi:MAG: hypothetical protein P8J55_02105 [Pseudomonadales bacterium]|nr:hypothetical protein [Pseudomonadales bacterium]